MQAFQTHKALLFDCLMSPFRTVLYSVTARQCFVYLPFVMWLSFAMRLQFLMRTFPMTVTFYGSAIYKVTRTCGAIVVNNETVICKATVSFYGSAITR